MVAMGGAWVGLWVAVLPHKGHKGHKPAAGKPQGPRASRSETLARLKPARGALGPAAANRGHPSANVKEQ